MAAYGEGGARWRRTERRDLRQDGSAGGGPGRGVGRQPRGREAAQEDGGRREAPVSNRGRGDPRGVSGNTHRGLQWGQRCGPGDAVLAPGSLGWRWGS